MTGPRAFRSPFGHRALLADGGFRHLGLRQASRILRGALHGTCVGLWLFTRVLIPDVMLTATVALAIWALLR